MYFEKNLIMSDFELNITENTTVSGISSKSLGITAVEMVNMKSPIGWKNKIPHPIGKKKESNLSM